MESWENSWLPLTSNDLKVVDVFIPTCVNSLEGNGDTPGFTSFQSETDKGSWKVCNTHKVDGFVFKLAN